MYRLDPTETEEIANFIASGARFFLPEEKSILNANKTKLATSHPFPYLQLDLEFPYEDMLLEARRLYSQFIPHRDKGSDNKGWKALVLHGLGEDKSNVPEHYGISAKDANYHWTSHAKLCPQTVSFVKSLALYDRIRRVRFMAVEPGGFIAPHKDQEDLGLKTMNLALNQPKECSFYMEGVGKIPWKAGRAFIFDLSRKHALLNESAEIRIHLIINGDWNEERKELLLQQSVQKFFHD